MATFCQYKRMLPFSVLILTLVGLQETSVKVNRCMALRYVLPSMLFQFLEETWEDFLIKALEASRLYDLILFHYYFLDTSKLQKTFLYAFGQLLVSGGAIWFSDVLITFYLRLKNYSQYLEEHSYCGYENILLCKPLKSI